MILLCKIIGAPKKFKNWLRPLFAPRIDHACTQKPNSSCETVPLSRAASTVQQNMYCTFM
jgi:hypothetical protein